MKIVSVAPPPLMDASAAALDALRAEVERLKLQLAAVRQESEDRLMSLRAELDAEARARAATPEPAPKPITAPAADPLFAQMWSYVNAPRG